MFLFAFNYWGKPHCAVCNESNLESLSNVPSATYEELASITIENYLKGWGIWLKDITPKDVKVYEVKNLPMQPIYSIAELDLAIPLIPLSK